MRETKKVLTLAQYGRTSTTIYSLYRTTCARTKQYTYWTQCVLIYGAFYGGFLSPRDRGPTRTLAPAYFAVFIALESQSSPAYSPSPVGLVAGLLSSDIFQRRSGSEFAHSRDLRLLSSFSVAARSSAS